MLIITLVKGQQLWWGDSCYLSLFFYCSFRLGTVFHWLVTHKLAKTQTDRWLSFVILSFKKFLYGICFDKFGYERWNGMKWHPGWVFFCNISRLWTFQIRLTIDHSWQIEITTFRVHSDWQPESDLDSNSCDVWECLANINALARIGWLASLISFTLPWPIWYSPHVPGLIFNSEKLNGRPTISTEEYLSLCTKFHSDDTNLSMIWHNH